MLIWQLRYNVDGIIIFVANSSAAAGGIIFFLSYLPFSFISPRYGTLSAMTKLVSCLDLNMAMSLGMVVIGKFEGTGKLSLDEEVTLLVMPRNISFMVMPMLLYHHEACGHNRYLYC